MARSISLPANSEQLRLRVRLIGITFQLAKYRHSNRRWLSSASPNVWLDHLDHVLGEDGYHIKFPEPAASRVPHNTLWQTTLAYEHAIRKEACRSIMFEQLDLADAMQKARTNSSLRDRFFITPLALALAAFRETSFRPSPSGPSKPSFAPYPTASRKGSGKGARTTGKGFKRRQHQLQWKSATPDGRKICFAYNRSKCHTQKCEFVHCCQVCFGPHPAPECKALAPGPDTAGSAAT